MSSFGAAALEGLGAVFSFPGILIPIAGTLIAMTTSFLPGIGSSSLIGIVLVATLTWDPVSVMLLFGALTGGATFMGSITAILFNIPGSTPSSAALLDGYPMGERGYPQTAIACAATASALGSLFGVVVLLTILPYIRPFLLAFGAFEMLLLGIWGLTTLIAVPNVSPLKGLAMCLLGFLVGMVGSDPISGDPRWTFGSFVLFQGLPLVSLMLGIFTFSELVGWARRYDLQAPTLSKRATDDTTWRGIVAVFRHWTLSLRSAIIGTVVGIIPGVGGTVAGFVAYGQAVSTTKDPNATFGKGDIRGLIAPESAIDSKDGGSLLPVISFGIPGSESGVILLLVFSIHGIVPGVNLLTEQLHLSYILIFALLFSNVLTSVIGVGLAPYLARLKDLRIDLIVLPALLISAAAIVQLQGQLSDLFVAVLFGIGAYFLRRNDWPRVPFVIALVLGLFLESNLSLSIRLIELGRISPWERPASLILIALTVVSLWWMTRRRVRKKRDFTTAEDLPVALCLAAVLTVLLAVAVFSARPYSAISIIVVSGALVAVLAIAATAWRAHGFALSIAVPNAHRVPLLTLACLPVAVILLGLPAGFAATVFAWQIALSNPSRRRVLGAGIAAVATGAATHLYVTRLANLLLPEPLIFSLWGG